jgi:predicted transcriptional regulator
MGSSTTVRVSDAAHALLREIAEQSQTSMSAVIEQALEEHRRRLFWAQARREFEQLRSDADTWQAEQEEATIWEASIGDGLDSDDER